MKADWQEAHGGLELDSRQLKGKQSVRATFRLSKQLIDLLKVAANHLEVQQKSLIDELVSSREVLDRVAKASPRDRQDSRERRQKTFVLSRNTLDILDDIAAAHGLSRDHLVELCIGRLIPFVDGEQQKHRQRKKLLEDMERYLNDCRTLLGKAERLLGRDDRFRGRLERIVEYSDRQVAELRQMVKYKESLDYSSGGQG